MGVGFQRIQNGYRRLRIVGNRNQADPALRLRPSCEASDGSTTVIWLPVSTMKSNGPAWLIFTGINEGPLNEPGVTPATFPGQRGWA